MEIISKNQLTEADLSDIHMLIKKCEEADQIKYNLYMGEEECENDYFLLLYDKSSIIGYICCFYADTPEVSGLIAPEYRRNGYFSNSLQKIPYKNYIFTGKDNWPGYAKASIKLGFNFCFHEFLMENKAFPELPINPLRLKRKGSQIFFYKFFSPIGYCRLFEENETINIFDVFVYEKNRNKGFGKCIISQILNIYSSHEKRIILQVSEKNKPAYKLYAACGFEVIDSVLYYSRLV